MKRLEDIQSPGAVTCSLNMFALGLVLLPQSHHRLSQEADALGVTELRNNPTNEVCLGLKHPRVFCTEIGYMRIHWILFTVYCS